MSSKTNRKQIKLDSNLKTEITGNETLGDLVGIMQNPDPILTKAGITIDLFDEIMSDTEVLSAYQKRKRKFIIYKYRIVSEDKKLETYLNDIFKTLPIDKLLNGLYKAIPYGYSVSELIWDKRTDLGFVPIEIKNRSPKKFGFNENGDLLYINDEGEFLAPYGKFVKYVNDLEDDNNPYGKALLSKIYWYWLFKKTGWKLWGYFLEKYGDPALIHKTSEFDETKREEFLQHLDNVRAGSNIVIGEDDEIKALEVKSGANVDYQKYIREADKQIDKVFLGSTMLMEDTQHGTYNTANQHGSDLEDMVLSDAIGISKAITRDLIDPILVFNYGLNYKGKAQFELYLDVNNDNSSNSNTSNNSKNFKKKDNNLDIYNINFSNNEQLPKNKQNIENLLNLLEIEQRRELKKLFNLNELPNKVNEALLELGNYLNNVQDMLSNSISKALFIAYLYAKEEILSYKDKQEYNLNDIEQFELKGLLPFDEARKLFKRRVDLTDKEYKELTKLAKSYAFSFAGAKTKTIAKTLHRSLLDELKKGSSGEGAWRREVGKNLLSEFGIEPLHKGHLANIYRTNLFTEYSKAKYKEYKKVEKYLPYLMYDAVGDNRTRPTHLALDGKIFKADSPIWDKIYPPNGYNCRCSVIPLTEKKAKDLGIDDYKQYIDNPDYQPDEGWDYNPGAGLNDYIKQPEIKPLSNQNTFKDYNLPKKYPIAKKIDFNIKKGKYKEKDNLQIFDKLGNITKITKDIDFNYDVNLIKEILLNPYEVWYLLGENEYNNLDYIAIYYSYIQDKEGDVYELYVVVDRLGQVIKIEDKGMRAGILMYNRQNNIEE